MIIVELDQPLVKHANWPKLCQYTHSKLLQAKIICFCRAPKFKRATVFPCEIHGFFRFLACTALLTISTVQFQFQFHFCQSILHTMLYFHNAIQYKYKYILQLATSNGYVTTN